jgi:hypothetical protein
MSEGEVGRESAFVSSFLASTKPSSYENASIASRLYNFSYNFVTLHYLRLKGYRTLVMIICIWNMVWAGFELYFYEMGFRATLAYVTFELMGFSLTLLNVLLLFYTAFWPSKRCSIMCFILLSILCAIYTVQLILTVLDYNATNATFLAPYLIYLSINLYTVYVIYKYWEYVIYNYNGGFGSGLRKSTDRLSFSFSNAEDAYRDSFSGGMEVFGIQSQIKSTVQSAAAAAAAANNKPVIASNKDVLHVI